MAASGVWPGLTSLPAGKRWTVAVMYDDLAHARQLVQRLEHADLCFQCVHPYTIERFDTARATFDVVMVHVLRERTDGSAQRELLRKYPGCVALLGRFATGSERAWWIEHGADDCLNHPFDKDEVLARLRASIRRRRTGSQVSKILTVGPLAISLVERTASVNGRRLALTSCEFALLAALAERSGQVVGREQLLELAWGSAERTFARAIDVQISRLRCKLHDDPREPKILKTVRGVGYVLVATEAFGATPSCRDRQ